MIQHRSDQEGLRQRKRRETLQRITESALRLFADRGYEATTLDAIADASGISRRTFFYYFKSKEEILAAWQKGLPEAFRAAILRESPDQSPIDAVRNAHLELLTHYDAARALIIDRIIRSSDLLRASNQMKYLELERAAFEALCERWPQRTREELRVTAMVSVGALRLAIDAWAEEDGRRPLEDHLAEAFVHLKIK
jgi:AcrR family transcriptional regulator